MNKTVTVFCRLRFEAAHRWIDAPDRYPFLRNYHRHEFHVQIGVEVTHDGRQVEFIDLKNQVRLWLDSHWAGRNLDLSCEQMASQLAESFMASYVEVSEDGENGAVVVTEKYTPPISAQGATRHVQHPLSYPHGSGT